MTTLNLTTEWDKTFPKSDKVEHQKVTFHNRYGIELAADMYTPVVADLKSATSESGISNPLQCKFAAIAVSGPFGAVKEQSSGLYAQHMAERGFLTIAFDPSYTGESGGEPRRTASPDINTEDFLAAVDFLSNQDNVDPERIGIIGICGFGGMAINAAALDPRIKATVASTMYDISRNAANGYFDENDNAEARNAMRRMMAEARTKAYKTGDYGRVGGVVDPLPEDAPWFVKDYHAYYKTPRGYHERSGNSTDGWNTIGVQSFMNQPLLAYAHEIDRPVLLIHGEKAHSRYFSETAFEKMTGQKVAIKREQSELASNAEREQTRPEVKPEPGKTTVIGRSAEGRSYTYENKELYIIPGAVHTDLYDDVNGKIPYDKLETFFKENLK